MVAADLNPIQVDLERHDAFASCDNGVVWMSVVWALPSVRTLLATVQVLFVTRMAYVGEPIHSTFVTSVTPFSALMSALL